MNIIVLKNQSLFDIAVQMFGSADAAFDIALANDLCVSDELAAGQALKLPVGAALAAAPQNRPIADYYTARGLKPATATNAALLAELEDIGAWAIGSTFIVGGGEGIGYWRITSNLTIH